MDWTNYDSRRFAWLAERAYNIHTQSGKDGLLEAIFGKIGETNRYVCEFGAVDGLFFSNSRRWIAQGWGGLLIEADGTAYQRLEMRYRENPQVTTVNALVESHGDNSLDNLLERAGAPRDL